MDESTPTPLRFTERPTIKVMKTIISTLLLSCLCAAAQTNVILSTVPNNTKGTQPCDNFHYRSFANVLGSTNQARFLFPDGNVTTFQFTNSTYLLFWQNTFGQIGCGFTSLSVTNPSKPGYRVTIYAPITLATNPLPLTVIGITNPPP